MKTTTEVVKQKGGPAPHSNNKAKLASRLPPQLPSQSPTKLPSQPVSELFNQFDQQRAFENGFLDEFNRWMSGVVDSRTIYSPLHAGLLVRAIQQFAIEYSERMELIESPSCAKEAWTSVVDGSIGSWDERVYQALGIEQEQQD